MVEFTAVALLKCIADSQTDDDTDPDISMVKLLMGFDDVNNSTGSPGMTDESPAAHGDATLGGAAKTSTAQSVFSGSSLALDGSSAYIVYGDHADWDLSNQSFTLECRIYTTTISGTHFIVGQWFSTGFEAWQLRLDGSTLRFDLAEFSNATHTVATSATTISTNTWYAVAVDFDGSKYRMYLDGVMVGSSATPYTMKNVSEYLSIGALVNGPQFFWSGYVDELRLTVGLARYASDGGYSVATSPFPRP
jgi:Concanavalin A-like lectin/glucanases superfamily